MSIPHLTSSLRAQVVSSLLAGAAVGSLGGSGLADTFGRRTTLLLDALPMAAGAVLSATASGLQVRPRSRGRQVGACGRVTEAHHAAAGRAGKCRRRGAVRHRVWPEVQPSS